MYGLAILTTGEVHLFPVAQQRIATAHALIVDVGIVAQGVTQGHFPNAPTANVNRRLRLLCNLGDSSLAKAFKYTVWKPLRQRS